MAVVSVTELKANLAKYLRMVKRGGEVYVIERGVAIARLVAMPRSSLKEPEALERLVSAGVVRRGSGGIGALTKRRLRVSVELLQAVLDERNEGR